MNIEMFGVCKSATENNELLSVTDVFDSLSTKGVPGIVNCSLFARIRFFSLENGKHQIRFQIIDEDGHAVMPVQQYMCEINVQIPDGLLSVVANPCLKVAGLKFDKPGNYSVNLAIDGNQMASVPLILRKM